MIFNIQKEDKKKTGIYCIKNLINNKIYIGSTSTSFYLRYHQHLSDYNAGKKNIKILYRAFDKYGKDNFEFSLVCICNKEDCIKMEQFYIDQGVDYNCCMIAGSMLGYKHPDTAKTRTVKGGDHHCAKVVYQFNLDGELIKKHSSIIEALKSIGKTKNGTSHITLVCKGETFSSFGYRWSFTNQVINREKRISKRKILLIKNDFTMEFNKQTEVAEYFRSIGYLKCNQGTVSNALMRKGVIYNHNIKYI